MLYYFAEDICICGYPEIHLVFHFIISDFYNRRMFVWLIETGGPSVSLIHWKNLKAIGSRTSLNDLKNLLVSPTETMPLILGYIVNSFIISLFSCFIFSCFSRRRLQEFKNLSISSGFYQFVAWRFSNNLWLSFKFLCEFSLDLGVFSILYLLFSLF